VRETKELITRFCWYQPIKKVMHAHFCLHRPILWWAKSNTVDLFKLSDSLQVGLDNLARFFPT